MRRFGLSEMTRGWFVGPFVPTGFHADEVEAACKKYRAGERESRHHHRVATEITLIVSGRVRMNGVEYGEGDGVVIEPMESTDFEVLEDAVTFVVKVPAVPNDKYEGDAAGC
jgi:hypothetical protein